MPTADYKRGGWGFSAMLAACLLLAASSFAQTPSVSSRSSSRLINVSPIFDIAIPKGYQDWKLVAVAHEEGNLNDLRAILGNDVAINAYRKNGSSFPDGAIIARLAWSYVPSEDNNKVFGRSQSFVAGPPTDAYLQFMVKDSNKYASTGGWGFAQFDRDGRPADEAHIRTCFPCHSAGNVGDLIFTHYAVR
jgi:hypothetical protein